MAKIQYLAVHCAATPESFKLDPSDILRWHIEENGWSRVGYSDLILRAGTLHNLSSFDQDNEVDYNEMTWGIKGLNGVTRHICLEGGKDNNGQYKNPLISYPKMVDPLATYIKHTINRHPHIKVLGHGDVDGRKAFCPGFSVSDFCRAIGVDAKNIY